MICLAVIVGVGGPCAVFALVFDRQPWWRKYPTLRRQIDNDRDAVKIYKLRKRYPEVFKNDPPIP